VTPAILLEQSADELVTASERLADVATEFRATALLCNLDTPRERLLHATQNVQADVVRLVMAALSAARAGERVATLTVVPDPRRPGGDSGDTGRAPPG
jgi:hypothetical protein